MGFDMLKEMPATAPGAHLPPPDVAFAPPDRRRFFDMLASITAQAGQTLTILLP